MIDTPVRKDIYAELPPAVRKELTRLVAQDTLAQVNALKQGVQPPQTFYTRYGKRMIDIVVSLLALIVTLPINLIIGLITFFDVGRPLLFAQKRMGRGETPFHLYKFRNMTNATNEQGFLLPANERVTRWGKFVRKTSLDELLNFWSIFKGDMSLIGPRPLPLSYRGRFSDYHNSRHTVRPGLDCPLHDPGMGYMTWENRLENDVWYVQHVSFKTDVQLVMLLVRETLGGKEKNARAVGGSEGSFIGYDADGRVMDSYHIPQHYLDLALSLAEEANEPGTIVEQTGSYLTQ